MVMKIKKDKYSIFRGGKSNLYFIKCKRCKLQLCIYQKDGLGPLLRMYLDRIYKGKAFIPSHIICKCPNCNKMIGVYYIYAKEKRLAIKLFASSITKSLIKEQQQ